MLEKFAKISTVRKFQDFSVDFFFFFAIVILRQINFRESRSSKTAVLAILRTLNFITLVNFCIQNLQKYIKSPNSEPVNVLQWQILILKIRQF